MSCDESTFVELFYVMSLNVVASRDIVAPCYIMGPFYIVPKTMIFVEVQNLRKFTWFTLLVVYTLINAY